MSISQKQLWYHQGQLLPMLDSISLKLFNKTLNVTKTLRFQSHLGPCNFQPWNHSRKSFASKFKQHDDWNEQLEEIWAFPVILAYVIRPTYPGTHKSAHNQSSVNSLTFHLMKCQLNRPATKQLKRGLHFHPNLFICLTSSVRLHKSYHKGSDRGWLTLYL